MFEYQGQELSVEDIQAVASKAGMSYENTLKALTDKGMVEKGKQKEEDDLSFSQKIQLGLAKAGAIDPTIRTNLSVLSSFAKGTIDIADSAFDLAEFGAQMSDPMSSHMYFAKRRAAAMAGMTYDEFEKQVEDPFNVVDLSRVSNFLDQSIIKFKDDKGKQLDYTELAEQGRFADAATSFVMETAGAAPSLLVSMLPGGYALLGGTSFVDKLNTDLVEKPDETLGQIMSNAIIYGGSDAVGEFFGGRFLRNMVKGVAPKPGAKIPGDVRDAMVGGVGGVVRSIFKGGGSEFLQESITSVIQSAGDDLIYGDDVTASQYFRKALHAGMIGFALGGGTGTVSTLKNRQDNEKFYEYLAPKSYKVQQVKLSQALEEAESDLKNAPADNKEIFQRKVDDIKNKKQQLKDQLYDRFQKMGLDKNEMQYYLDNENAKHKALDIITGGRKFSDQAKEQAKKDFMEAAQNNEDLFAVTDLNYDADVELQLGKSFKAAEKIDQRNKNLWFKSKDLSYEYLDTQEKYDEARKKYGKDVVNEADGFFETTVDGKSKIFINRDVAAAAEATNVIGHELLHYAISNRFANDPEALKASVVAFTKYLDEVDPFIRKSIEKRLANPKNGYAKLDANGKVQRDENGLIVMNKESYIEEYFNMFSDLIDKKKIKAVEEASDGIKNSFRSMVRGLGGFNKVDFKNGQEVFNLLVDYNKNINREGLLGRVTQKKIIETVSGRKVQTRKAEDIKKSVSKDIDTELVKDTSFEDKIQKLYQDPATWLDIEQAYKPRIKRVLRANYSWIEDLDNQNNTNKLDAVIEEAVGPNRGILEMITKYNPESGVPLSGYIGSIMKKRGLMEYVQREFPEGVIQQNLGTREDVQKQVAKVEAEQDVEADIETEDLSIQAQNQQEESDQYSTTRRKLTVDGEQGISDAIVEKVKQAVVKTMATERLTPDSDKFVKNLKKSFLTELKKPIQDMMGTKDKFETFLRENRETIINALPTATLVQMERKVEVEDRVFTTEVKRNLSPTEVDKAIAEGKLPKNTGRNTGPTLYEKRMPTPAEFVKYYNPPAVDPKTGKRSGLKGTRKDTLAEQLGIELAFDATMEVVQSADVAERRALVTGNDFGKTEISKLARAIDRGIDVKFSKSQITEAANEFDIQTVLSGVTEQLTPKQRLKLDAFFKRNLDAIPQTKEVLEAIVANQKRRRPKKISTIVEEVLRKNFKLATKNNKNIKVNSSSNAYGILADVTMEANNQIVGIEGKSKTGRGVNRTIAISNINKFLEDQSNFKVAQDKKSIDNNKSIQKLLAKNKKALKDIADFLNINDINQEITEQQYNDLKDSGLLAAFTDVVLVDSEFVGFDYINKPIPSQYIQMGDAGFFVFFKEINPLDINDNLNIQEFSGVKIPLGRRFTRRRLANGNFKLVLRVEPQLSDNLFKTQKLNAYNKSDVETITNQANNDVKQSKTEKAVMQARSMKYSKTSRGMSTFDFDETLIIDGKNFIVATKGDDVQRISSGDWPLKGPKFAEEGYSFDFADFVNVRGGVDGPLLKKFKERLKKFGPSNMYVLTARPQESATAIHGWLKSKGLEIPLKNITGLGNSTGEAKAMWMLEKFAEGYNDMYFVDDALPNVAAVKNVLDQLDIKSDVQQAKIKFSRTMSDDFNQMLERTKGVPFDETFSRARALKLGKNKGKFQIFVPPSADDFEGLLYYFVGKGEQGNKDLEFFKKAVIDPFSRAYTELDQSRQTIINDWNNLRKKHWRVSDKLGEMMPNSEFTFDNAIRVYLYNKADRDVPGLSEQEINNLVERVKADNSLLSFANDLQAILKLDDVYLKPSEYWIAGSTASDVNEVSEKVRRADFLTEWVENKNEIFSEANLNKIEATYGSRFRSALEDVLYRMETGRTRSEGSADAISNKWMRWLNNSVGAIMFLNVKSALLQTISTVNYVNYTDNNPLQAARAFANQKQYWQDFTMIFNSDFLKQRRKGLKTDVQTAEIASAVAGAANKAQAAVAYLLKKGFLPTQIADSFAISAGGATFYRNRYKSYIKQGLSETEAKEKAFNDFRNSTEESQQSARPDRISQQQVSNAGRLLLNFQNYPMQQARIFKKAILGLSRGTGDAKQHLARIAFYGFAQNMIFLSLQNALFAMLFDHEDEEEEQKLFDTKIERILNGMVDTILRGSGIAGGVIATLKNTMLKAVQELEKGPRANEANIILEAVNISPAIGSKIRKINKGFRTYKWNNDAINEMSKLDLRNPLWTTAAPVIEGVTNIPTDRAIRKINNMREAFDDQNSRYQRLAVLLGYSPYELGIDPDKEVKEAKKEGKRKDKEEKQGKKVRCRAFSSSGGRCKNTTTNKSGLCYAHD